LQLRGRSSYGEDVTDPEDVTELQKADLIEVEVDETPDDERPLPLEADPADVSEQRVEVHEDDEPDPDIEY
jgi:hypothetical protein